MFEHSLSEECKYAEKCNKKLCSFQHITHGVSMNQFKGNSMLDEPLENSNDGEGDAVIDLIMRTKMMKTSIYMLSITFLMFMKVLYLEKVRLIVIYASIVQ